MQKLIHRRLALTTIALSAFVALPAAGQTINEDLKLTASDGASADWFAWSIAIDNGIVAVGSPQDDDNGLASGSAYIFNASTGQELIKLLPDDGAAGDLFGTSIAIDNGIIAIGAPRDDDNGLTSGSVYLFDATTGEQLTKLIALDGEPENQFGISVAIQSGVVAVGAFRDNDNGIVSGSAYLFDATSGNQLAKLLPDDGAVGYQFGNSIAIDNGVVAIGSIWDDANGNESGSAYLFDVSTHAQLFKLLSNDGVASDNFGKSIALDDGIVVVGTPGADPNGLSSGAAYAFDAATGLQLAKMIPSDGGQNSLFGNSVTIENGLVIVGAQLSNDGKAYFFNAVDGKQIGKLLPSEGTADAHFGWATSIDNGIIAIGAISGMSNGTDSGLAYLFSAPATACLADLTGDGMLNFFDVSAFLSAFNKMNPIADFTNDGQFNFFDVSAFLQAFAAGCP